MGDRIYAYLVEVTIEPDEGQFYAHCPGLEGVHESGKTPEEALENAYDAVLSIIEAHHTQGDPVPEGPHLIALRRPPTLPMKGLISSSRKKGQRAGTRRSEEFLVPAPA